MNKKLVILILLLNSCIAEKQISETGVNEIQFGNGGGFAGKEVGFTLGQDGLIKNQNDSIVNKIDKKVVLSIFKTASKNKNVEFLKPQNLYSFLTIISPSSPNKIIWGRETNTVSKDIRDLHKKLMNKAIQKNEDN
ncbi:hypothetical protein [Mesonia aquimarina]|uniref:hypothetical protein n=1 Tax=Mesonia aquimarina TaxID=1504967 RepID=UPI000EF55EC4|nr:hypothetical protein [Mesonia aquimarina]